MDPKISVLLPVYNAERFVSIAIQSILAQTYNDFELLIIDDGSTDDTARILRRFQDDRMRVVTHAGNHGLSATLAEGLQMARGDLIGRQDADDWSYPERLAKQVAFLVAHPHVAVVGSQARIVDERGLRIGHIERSLQHVSILWSHLFDNALVHTSVLARRSTIEQLG
jgi:glycosyltransferase involved in cell wall biosynthesis